ncbi:MAG: MaoC family dehydratase N-terminal domain-containing protein [Pseudomonadota bacterium]
MAAHVVRDSLDPARAAALLTALGRAPEGDVLPPFFHHLYFWEPVAPDGLGRDGHPKVGGLIPDMGLPRRMWAGGRLTFHAPLRAGQPAERATQVITAERKEGRSGPLAFVTLQHQITQNGALCVTEEQDLVYRADPDPSAPRPVPPEAPEGGAVRKVRFDSTLLFRYSALTFNGHRIHYDEAYAREVEGYDGLVVHGPLLAQLLMLEAGPLERFSFRATAPLMHHEAAILCRDGAQMWVRGPDGRLCMRAELS